MQGGNDDGLDGDDEGAALCCGGDTGEQCAAAAADGDDDRVPVRDVGEDLLADGAGGDLGLVVGVAGLDPSAPSRTAVSSTACKIV